MQKRFYFYEVRNFTREKCQTSATDAAIHREARTPFGLLRENTCVMHYKYGVFRYLNKRRESINIPIVRIIAYFHFQPFYLVFPFPLLPRDTLGE